MYSLLPDEESSFERLLRIGPLGNSSLKNLVFAALTAVLFFSFFFYVTADAQQISENDRIFEKAYKEVLKDPGNLDKSFRFTQLAIERGDFEAAISALERMLITNPSLPRVRLELGVLYFRLGSYALAKSYLESAVKGKNVPPVVRERVGVFLVKINELLSKSKLSGSASAGLRYQTNANAGPDSPSVLLFGIPAELDEAYTSKKDGNFFGALNLRHVYDLETQEQTTLDTDLFVFGSKHLEQDQIDILFLEVVAGPRFRVASEGRANTLIRPFVSGNVIHLGEDILYSSFGGGLEISRQINDGLGVTMRYDARDKRFDNNTSRPAASDEDGVEQSGHVTAAFSITPTVNAFARVRVKAHDAQVDYEANREYGGLAGLSVSYEPPIGNPSRRWLTSVSSEFSFVKYKAPDPAVSLTTQREDKKWSLRVQTNIPLSKLVSLGIGVTHSRNSSNLPNFEQTNTGVAASLSRSF